MQILYIKRTRAIPSVFCFTAAEVSNNFPNRSSTSDASRFWEFFFWDRENIFFTQTKIRYVFVCAQGGIYNFFVEKKMPTGYACPIPLENSQVYSLPPMISELFRNAAQLIVLKRYQNGGKLFKSFIKDAWCRWSTEKSIFAGNDYNFSCFGDS